MMIKKLTLLLTLLLVSNISMGQMVAKVTTIESINVRGSGAFELFMADAVGGNCYDGDKRIKAFPGGSELTEVGMNRLLSVAVAAKLAGSRVKVTFDSASKNCYLNELRIL